MNQYDGTTEQEKGNVIFHWDVDKKIEPIHSRSIKWLVQFTDIKWILIWNATAYKWLAIIIHLVFLLWTHAQQSSCSREIIERNEESALNMWNSFSVCISVSLIEHREVYYSGVSCRPSKQRHTASKAYIN